MKKMLALILALAMVLSMSVSAFAATASDFTNNGFKDENVTVNVVATDTVYKVSITWDELAFTYSLGSWNTTDHVYGKGSWNKESADITVVNHSNAAVTVKAEYASEDTQVNGATINFSGTGAEETLASAAEVALGAPNVTDRANARTYKVTVSGNPTDVKAVTTVGKVTVTISGITTP